MAYTKAERAKLTERALDLSLRGLSALRIAREIGVSDTTIRKWMNDELAKRSEHRSNDKERAIARYEKIIRDAWETYEETEKLSPNNVSGLLNTIRACQERIDKLTGAEAPIKHQHVDEEIVVEWEDLDSVFVEES